jgi:Arc/MetJ family transcription regulator
MMRLRHAISSYLPPAEYRRLQQEAAARGASLSKCVADCLREYLALRADMASVALAPGELGEPHQGVIHTLLARTEERLAATLAAHAARTAGLHETLRVVESMLDRLTLLYLTHTPEIPQERRDDAVAMAKRRYLKWRHAVEEQARAGGGNGDSAGVAAAEEQGTGG